MESNGPSEVNESTDVESNGSKVSFNFSNDQSDDGKSRCDSIASRVSGVSQFSKIHINNNNERRSSLRRNVSKGNLMSSDHTESKVLVIYTGGTIGMMRNENDVLCPMPNALVKNLRKYPNMHDEQYAQKKYGPAANMAPLVLPHVVGEGRRVIYTITEYDPLLDSSNMSINDWIRIAEDIKQSYEFFDGFLILHGTDTLSYTASALSFMLENLGKTVIITGSQIPIFETRTDGKDNFTAALIIAGNYVIPEVCVMFGTKLMRGNRTVKVSANCLDAFNTPNTAPIAQIGISLNVDYRLIFRPCTVSKFAVHVKLDENVGLLRIFPSISLATIKAFLNPPIMGVVLQTFGAGNIPSNRADIIDELKSATDRGAIIVNCTQCASGAVKEIYETGSVLRECGVISGFDMTVEAALTKLSYVLGKDEWTLDTKKQMMEQNIRGELTSGKPIQDFDLVDAVARSLHLSSPKQLIQLGATLFPAMVNTAVVQGDKEKLNTLKSYGADLSAMNYDQRTALQIACCIGDYDIVKYLLLNGVSVHTRDRNDRTALIDAINKDYHDIIKLLVKCGSHMTGSSRLIGEHLCAAAARGLVKRMESYRLAGADLSQPDPSGRTPLHLAALHGHVDLVKYLIKSHVELDDVDMLGLSPLDYAMKVKNEEIVAILSEKLAASEG
ncbi:L-asparaginase [Bradysia coprophila]|uniref:L-asparaginase n=1 Tax=Bradysia coprophila TaxID=38358 RepID=UPI00187D713F|nr:L-asparaginase [Bradysia coprophila]